MNHREITPLLNRITRFVLLGLTLSIFMTVSSCGRKDVNRKGNIKLRGEKPVRLDRRGAGDLLQKGRASWYGHPFHGRQTASGERYDMHQLTAAHKTLPFGTMVRVVNLDNSRETLVKINDRGPFVKDRIIDLSRAAAEDIRMIGPGTAQVAIYLEARPRGSRVVRGNQTAKDGFWTIQVGSFRELARAEQMVNHMRTFESEVFMELIPDHYRVRVGRFKNREQAERLARRLQREDIAPWVVFVRHGVRQ